jgi:hypothetical protein
VAQGSQANLAVSPRRVGRLAARRDGDRQNQGDLLQHGERATIRKTFDSTVRRSGRRMTV